MTVQGRVTIAVLKERQAGVAVVELCRKHGTSDVLQVARSMAGWKSPTLALKAPEDENHSLKKLLAEAMLDGAAPGSFIRALTKCSLQSSDAHQHEAERFLPMPSSKEWS